MRNFEERCETFLFWLISCVLMNLGVGSTIFCIKNANIVTSENWFASIVLAVGGIILNIFIVYCIITDDKK